MNHFIPALFGIRYPIVQGGMGNISSPDLAQAVSEAGGLGTIGAGTMSKEQVESRIIAIKDKTSRPFCLNIPLSVHPDCRAVLQLVKKHRVPAVSLSAGNPEPYVEQLKEAGAKVLVVVASVRQAKKAEKAGCDAVVCEGYESAGIQSPYGTTTFTLVPQVVRAVNVPVIAAGGIADGYGLLAAFALGASGVQLGTRLVATQDAPFHPAYKDALLKATDVDTVVVGRNRKTARRLLKTAYAERLLTAEKTLDEQEWLEKTAEDRHAAAAIQGNLEEGFLNAGQNCGLINDLPTVKILFERMMSEAQSRLVNLEKIFSSHSRRHQID